MFQIPNLIEGTVVKRPSKMIKTPYVADVMIHGDSESESREVITHSASLGCCGLADANAVVLMCDIVSTSASKKEIKCSHRIYLSVHREGEHEVLVGIYPKLAENLVENALKQNLLSSLRNLVSYKRETVIKNAELGVDSRFDFSGMDSIFQRQFRQNFKIDT
jgi:DNA-binding sugar fermentation-stimulating protein